MPSAAKVDKDQKAEFIDSYRQTIKVIEHKIRNLEKRKGKLDAYKQEQEQGKELNADQLAAVSKYNEVIQQLDFSRDLMKQLGQVGEDTNRAYKRQQKKEQTERVLLETDRYRQLLVFQRVLDKLSNDKRVRHDFLHGVYGTVNLTQEDVNSLDEFGSLICPEKDDSDYLKLVEIAAEHITYLFQGKAKPVAGKTYKDIYALLLSISACEYFDPQKQQHHQQQSVLVDEPEPHLVSSETPTPPPVAPDSVIDPVPAQDIHSQESTYNFMQESQIDIESPHMDPAVVSVSSFVPPALQQMNNSQNVFSSSVDNINVALNDMSLNRLNTKNEEEQIEEWESSGTIPNTSTTFNNAPLDANGRGDGSNNMFDKTVRGGFRGNRGGRGRGSTNGYGGGRDYRGGPRGNRGGYQNGRGGYREPRNDRNDADLDPNVFEVNRNTRKRRGVPYAPYSDVTPHSNVAYHTGVNQNANAFTAAPSSGQQQQTRGGRVQMPPNRLNVSYPKN